MSLLCGAFPLFVAAQAIAPSGGAPAALPPPPGCAARMAHHAFHAAGFDPPKPYPAHQLGEPVLPDGGQAYLIPPGMDFCLPPAPPSRRGAKRLPAPTLAASHPPETLQRLRTALAEPADADFESRVRAVLDVPQALRFFALCAILADTSPGAFTSRGGNVWLVEPAPGAPIQIHPRDLSRMCQHPYLSILATQEPAVRRFLSHSAFAPLYRAEIQRLLDDILTPEAIDRWVEAESAMDVASGNPDAADEAAQLREFWRVRRRELHAQLPAALAVEWIPPKALFLVYPSTTWKRHLPLEIGDRILFPSDAPPHEWITADFDDILTRGWLDSPMPWGYDTSTSPAAAFGGGTYLPPRERSDLYTTLYARRRFEWKGPNPPDLPRLTIVSNGGWIAYLNAVEVGRHNLPPGPVSSREPALASLPSPRPHTLDLRPHAQRITPGENILALEFHRPSGPSPSQPLFLDAWLAIGAFSPDNAWIGPGPAQFLVTAPVPAIRTVRIGRQTWSIDPWTASVRGELEVANGWNALLFEGLDEQGRVAGQFPVSLLVAPGPSLAPTRVNADTTLGPRESPWLLLDSLELAPRATLRLEPGALLLAAPWTSIFLGDSADIAGLPPDAKAATFAPPRSAPGPDLPAAILPADKFAGWGGIHSSSASATGSSASPPGASTP